MLSGAGKRGKRASSCRAEPDRSFLQEEREEEELVGREKRFYVGSYAQEITLNRISDEFFVSNLVQIQT